MPGPEEFSVGIIDWTKTKALYLAFRICLKSCRGAEQTKGQTK